MRLRRLKVKITLEGQMIKWLLIELSGTLLVP